MAKQNQGSRRMDHLVIQGALACVALLGLLMVHSGSPAHTTSRECFQLLCCILAWLAVSASLYAAMRHEDRNRHLSIFLLGFFGLILYGTYSLADYQTFAEMHPSMLKSASQLLLSASRHSLLLMFHIAISIGLCWRCGLTFETLFSLLPKSRRSARGQVSGSWDTSGATERSDGAPAALSARIIESIFVPMGNLAAISDATESDERDYVQSVVTWLRLPREQEKQARKYLEQGKACSPSAAFLRISHSALAARGSEFHERAFRLAAGILFVCGRLNPDEEKKFFMASEAYHVASDRREEIRAELEKLFDGADGR